MSYAMSAPVAFRASESARAAFIRRTYAHLAGAILALVCLEFLLLQIPGVENLVISLGHAWLVVVLLFMGVSWLANAWAHSDTSPVVQYLGLALYTAAISVVFLPLLYVAYHYYPGAIQSAGILTLAVFGGLTAAVFVTRKDFSFLGPILMVGSFLALGFIICGLFLPMGFSVGLFFCFAMVALLSGYILFYTSNVLHHYRTDQHVAAALALFSSIATLFYYILIIVMSNRE